MRKPPPPPLRSRQDYEALCGSDAFQSNRLMFEWLCDDERRAELYGWVGKEDIPIQSRSHRDENQTPPAAAKGHELARLVTCPDRIQAILRDDGRLYSNDPYAQLGGGGFMLALDPANTNHDEQRRIAKAVFPADDEVKQLAALAVRSAAVLSLRRGVVDVADFAEQAALRFCSDLFGFALKDFLVLEAAARQAYRALNYVNFARHFVTEPGLLPQARLDMGRLLRRTAELIDEYAQKTWPARPDDCVPLEGFDAFRPVLSRLAEGVEVADPKRKPGATVRVPDGSFSNEQRAVLAVGLIAGTVGNVQAAACIAVKAFFKHHVDEEVRRRLFDMQSPTDLERTLWPCIVEALRLNPPVPLLPRRDTQKRQQLLLAVGAATARGKPQFHLPPASAKPAPMSLEDALVFGGMEFGTHWCLGRLLAVPLTLQIVQRVMTLPGLDEQLDPLDGLPVGLEKRWAFKCERYPLLYRSADLRMQQTLNVAMRVKSPIDQHAEALRQVIRVAAPRIEQVLREAAHVHFAWFEFIEDDTRLVLHTIYDSDFDAYILHFADVAGDLFDQLFEHIEDAPPRPVAKHRLEFLSLIRRYNRPPAVQFLFSAYPKTDTAAITRLERSRR